VAGHRPHFDRDAVLRRVAEQLSITPGGGRGLFADLKSEQSRLVQTSAPSDCCRHNVAAGPGRPVRAVGSPWTCEEAAASCGSALAKFHRLVCEVRKTDAEAIQMQLDGPLSLFTATQKYGLQLALIPAGGAALP
jgi:predicted nuclease of restriction endonuclease-like RecB superfamily